MIEKRPKFLLDENLGKLAKWLRILGYDSVVYKSISIEKKVSICIKERRIFLTKSKKIAGRKESFSRILIISENYDRQLQEISNLLISREDLLFSRCTECNFNLQVVKKEKIEKLIPEHVNNNFEEFNICRKCGKIYWKGSHYNAIKSKLKNLLTITSTDKKNI